MPNDHIRHSDACESAAGAANSEECADATTSTPLPDGLGYTPLEADGTSARGYPTPTNHAIADLANPSLLATALSEPSLLSPLRYPGGKRRLAPFIAEVLADNELEPDLTVEPFAGGASVSLYLLQKGLTARIGLADVDPLVASFWCAVFFDTDWLVDQIGAVPLTLEQWERFKAADPQDTRAQALACLFLNRTSFSGILARTAGPLGGKAQKSKYKLSCRFPRAALQQRVRNLGAMRAKVAFVRQWSWPETFAAIQEEAKRKSVFTYLDPPFFDKAARLYRCTFAASDHVRLRDEVINLSGDWLLSYDSVPKVNELYAGQQRLSLRAIYTASTAGGYRQMSEAVVSNLQLPAVEEAP